MSDEASEFEGGDVQVVPFDDLPEIYTVPGAREGGYLRWLKSWVGGPAGNVNPNLGTGAVVSNELSVGFMRMAVGCRQKGLHSHSVAEIYVILRGEVESYDGAGEKHIAGPMDCMYIPRDVPHAVRNLAREDLDLLWVHDGMEPKNNIKYYYSEADTPRIGGVSIIRYASLEPHWNAPQARESPFLRFLVSYVGPRDSSYNPDHAYASTRCAITLKVIFPGNSDLAVSLPHSGCYVVVDGHAIVSFGSGKTEKTLARLDGLWVPKGIERTIRNPGGELLWIVWTTGSPQCEGVAQPVPQ